MRSLKEVIATIRKDEVPNSEGFLNRENPAYLEYILVDKYGNEISIPFPLGIPADLMDKYIDDLLFSRADD